MWDVLGLGCVTLDEFIYVAGYPQPNTKLEAVKRERQIGGLTAVALVAAQQLGASCAYAAMLGHDDISQAVERELKQAGVDVSHIVYRDDAQPIYSTIIVDQVAHTRTILYTIGGKVGADDNLPTADDIRAAKVLFIDAFGGKGAVRAAKIARDAGIPIVADFESADQPDFDEMFSIVNHLILPLEFAKHITQTSDAERAAQALWTPARDVVVVTCGADGGYYLTAQSDTPTRYPAFEVEVVNTTGCGDVFHGAYAAALAQGQTAHERILFASAAAALKAANQGAYLGIPNRETVEKLLKG